MPVTTLYAAHVATRQQARPRPRSRRPATTRCVLSRGAPFTYFADDQDAPFHPTPHFAHWVPLEGPRHLLARAPGQSARSSSASRPRTTGTSRRRSAIRSGRASSSSTRSERGAEAWKRVARRRRASRTSATRPRGAAQHGIADGAMQPAGARRAPRLGPQLQDALRGRVPRGGDAKRAARGHTARARRRSTAGASRARDPPRLRRRRRLRRPRAALRDDRRARREGRDAALPRQAHARATARCS